MRWLIKMMSKTNKSKRGFTLIELMVVVIVVGILAAAAVPIYRFAMSRAYSSEAKATMGTMLSSMKMFQAEDPATWEARCLGKSSNETTIADDIMSILGVDTSTNTWWHAGWEGTDPANNELTEATATCEFGTIASGGTFPSGFSKIVGGDVTGLGPYVYAYGIGAVEKKIGGIEVFYDMDEDKWYTAY